MHINYILTRLKILEDVFGKGWLENTNKNEKKKSTEKRQKHRVQEVWAKVQYSISGARSGTPVAIEDHHIEAVELSQILEPIYKSEGFHQLMLPKLTEKHLEPQYDSFLYEAKIASLHANSGRKVKFIPTLDRQSIKAPDIGIVVDASTIRIECKRKVRITPRSISPDKTEFYGKRIKELLEAVTDSCAARLSF